jgi:8-amino-3,8-dideoxy-alpha-D-manno-octulosonate transaminase
MTMERRKFFAAVAAAGGAFAQTGPEPAATGGKPVRETMLAPKFFGPEYYGEEERRELVEVVETKRPFRWYSSGHGDPVKVLTFEKEYAARMQTRYALAVTSGTAALITALAALQVGPGDEVILPAWTWYACYNAIVLHGALPVFAEIDESLGIDPADMESKITPHTKAIMPVHTYGNPCNMSRIMEIAQKHKVAVVEDCAQTLGGSIQGRPVGSFGDINIFSLQLCKTITSGEGGVVTTSNPALFERASRFHDLGLLRPPHEQMLGKGATGMFPSSQFRMSEFTGGVALAQLRKLDRILATVRRHADRVYQGIGDLPGIRFRPRVDAQGDVAIGVFLIFDSRTRCSRFIKGMLAERINARGAGASVILPVQPYIENKVTLHPAWPSFTSERGRSIQYGASCCPRTNEILGRVACVPLDPTYTRQDVDDIITAIRKVYPAVMRA